MRYEDHFSVGSEKGSRMVHKRKMSTCSWLGHIFVLFVQVSEEVGQCGPFCNDARPINRCRTRLDDYQR